MILVKGTTGQWGAPPSAGWRHSATTWSQRSGTSKAASRRLPSGIALLVAGYEDASALKRAFAGLDDMVLISSGGDASAVISFFEHVPESGRLHSRLAVP